MFVICCHCTVFCTRSGATWHFDEMWASVWICELSCLMTVEVNKQKNNELNEKVINYKNIHSITLSCLCKRGSINLLVFLICSEHHFTVRSRCNVASVFRVHIHATVTSTPSSLSIFIIPSANRRGGGHERCWLSWSSFDRDYSAGLWRNATIKDINRRHMTQHTAEIIWKCPYKNCVMICSGHLL